MKRRNAAEKSGAEEMAKMTLRDNLAPEKGVTVLEATNQPDYGLGNTMKGSSMPRKTSLMET